MFIKCKPRERYLFLISSRISGPDGPVGFEPEISGKWTSTLFVYTTRKRLHKNKSSHETSESGPLFYGKDFGLKRKKKECNFVGFSFQEQSEKASVGYYLHKITWSCDTATIKGDLRYLEDLFDWLLLDGGFWMSDGGGLEFLGPTGSLIRLSTSPESWMTMRMGGGGIVDMRRHTHAHKQLSPSLLIQGSCVFRKHAIKRRSCSLSKYPELSTWSTWPLWINMTWKT